MEQIEVGESVIKMDEAGQVDEITVRNRHGDVLFHLERMTDGLFFSSVREEDSTRRVVVNFSSTSRIQANHIDFDLL